MSTTAFNVTERFTEATLAQVAPAKRNVRFTLNPKRVAALAAQIKSDGRVRMPLEVTGYDTPVDGYLYEVKTGSYRRAAVELLAKQGVTLSLPIVLVDSVDEKQTILDQISENKRTEMSIMDKASAMKQMFDVGATRKEVMEAFAEPTGKKGELKPISNALVNMYLSFLSLPKAVQTALDDGSWQVSAAYELSKAKPDKRDQMIADIQEERAELEASLAKDEEKLLEAEKKEQIAKAQVTELEQKRIELANAAKTAEELLKQAADKEAELYKASKAEKDKDAKAKLEEQFKLAESARKEAEKSAATAAKEVDKVSKKALSLAEQIEARKKKLEDARKAASKKPVTQTEVKKAAAKTANGDDQYVKLTGAQMFKVAEELALPGSFPKVQKIGEFILDCFKGKDTPAQLTTKLAKLTGEKK